MSEVQSLGNGRIRLVWRAYALWLIAWCLGISNHVITRAVK